MQPSQISQTALTDKDIPWDKPSPSASLATNTVEEIPWDDVDGSASEFEDVYPRLQWNHGRAALEDVGGFPYTGGIFLPEKQIGEFEAPGWSRTKFRTQKNEVIWGYHCPRPRLAVIRMTKIWGEKSSHTYALVGLQGRSELFEVSLEGVTKGRAFEQAFEAFRRQLLAPVNRNRPRNAKELEPLGLWFVIEAGPHETYQGKDGESETTPPRLYLPSNADLGYARSLYVGRTNYDLFRDYFQSTAKWSPGKNKQAAAAPRNPLIEQFQALLLWIGNQGYDVSLEERELLTGYRAETVDQLTESELRECLEALQKRKRFIINQRAMDAQR